MKSFSVVVLGIRVLSVFVAEPEPEPERETAEPDLRGDVTTIPLGFTASSGDQRWAEHRTPDFT